MTVYDRALTPAAVQAIFAAGPAGKSSPSRAGVVVNLLLGTASGVGGGVRHIQSVNGSQGDDVLVGGDPGSLFGGPGRDLLIGGGPDDHALFGGADDDILIAGTTAYDRDPAKLDAVLAVWADRSSDYASRVAALRGGLLAPGKVWGGRRPSTLIDGEGRNLYFVSAADYPFMNPDDTRVDL